MENNTQATIGLSALEADQKFDEVIAWVYHFTVVPWREDENAVKRCRRLANMVSAQHQWMPVTELDSYSLVTLQPVNQLEYDYKGERLVLSNQDQVLLYSNVEKHRKAIERLISQDIYQAVMLLAKQRKTIRAERNNSNVVIVDNEPSDRFDFKRDYLNLFQTVQLEPKLLYCGTLLLELHIRHNIVANAHITLDWIEKHRPEWVNKIGRVRHTYLEPARGYGVAELIGFDDTMTVNTPIQALGKTLLEYHRDKGLLSETELRHVSRSKVVMVRYGKNKDHVPHLACLLQPMFDFDTLQQIDSVLLNKITKNIKWSISERLKTAYRLVKGIRLTVSKAQFSPLKFDNFYSLSVKPDIKLTFSKGKADNERAVLRLKAFSNMTRQKVIPLIVGKHSEAQQDVIFSKIKKAYETCQSFCSEKLPPLTKLPDPIVSADALDQRLNNTGNRFDNAILLIALANGDPKKQIRDVAFSHKIATQFMRYDHRPNHYSDSYYHNLAAGLFSKGGGQLCAIENMPGDSDLFIGLDMGGVTTRSPGFAFLFTREGAQLGWQLADRQKGERMNDEALKLLLQKSLTLYKKAHKGESPKRITLHRDGKFYESLDVIKNFSEQHHVELDVLEVLKSGAPVLYRRHPPVPPETKSNFSNPEVGDAVLFPCQNEIVVSTYSGAELGKNWGNAVSVRPLRLRKRYGSTDLVILAQQVVLLSRIHGASLYRHPRLPVTTHHADRFATLRQDVDIDALGQMDRMCPVYL